MMSRQQRRALSRRAERVIVHHALGELIEAFITRWLRETPMGRGLAAASPGMSHDETLDAVFELLNAGFLKITGTEDAFTGIEICMPPRPPVAAIERPHRTLQ